MRKRYDDFDVARINIKREKGNMPGPLESYFDNYISPYWYGNIIDNSSKLENLKSIYEAFRSGFITVEDFHQSLTEMNDNRPMAKSV